MRIDIITLFPQLVAAVAASGVTGKAVDNALLDLHYWNPRDLRQTSIVLLMIAHTVAVQVW